MQFDGLKPTQGPKPADRTAGKAKAEPKTGGKSFADLLGKAQASSRPAAPAPGPASAPSSEPPPTENPIDRVRHRMQSGYYNNPKIDDALSDKLSGYFDDVA